jgi:hypothetical protein
MPNKLPSRAATGISRQALDLAHRFGSLNAGYREKSAKFPFQREKPGILPPPRGNRRAP